VTVERARKHGAGNCRYRGGLRRTARPAVATTRRRRVPDPLTSVGAESKYAATLFCVEFVFPTVTLQTQTYARSPRFPKEADRYCLEPFAKTDACLAVV
jgi:hypothetical protein